VSQARRAAAAARRLDDAFRGFLAERGTKHLPLAEVSRLLTGVVRLRASADAVLDLWLAEADPVAEDPAGARVELQAGADRITGWYTRLAAALARGERVPDPLEHDNAIGARFVAAMRRDLGAAGGDGGDGGDPATATAARMIWTGDHIDSARRMQHELVGPARVAARAQRPGTLFHPAAGRQG
jgi:hypothetical protein